MSLPRTVSRGPARATPSGAGRWHSLRGRTALGSGALALVLTSVMALSVWWAVSGFLLLDRERAAGVQASADAAALSRSLTEDVRPPSDALAGLPREPGATSLAVVGDEWFTTSLDVGREDLPDSLRQAVVEDRVPSRQRFSGDDGTLLATGVPLPDGDAYFAVLSLDELEGTLRVLALVLAAAVAVVPAAAVALGWWLTRSALRPLARLSEAAVGIAAGDLTTRLDPRGDPALVPIATSFNATAAALERRVRADARFATDVAHELRSPLTTMLAAVDLVEDGRGRPGPESAEALNLLRSSVDRFSRLVQDLLDMSRSDAGDAQLVLDDVRLAELVEQSTPAALRPRLHVELAARDVVVRVDKRRLERVVSNLVDNAEQHGRGLRSLTVGRSGGTAHLWVDDAGPGIRPADRERVFERFTRAGTAGTGPDATPGVGLGLALAAGHLQLMGGRVSVDDSPEGGARFVVTLPVQQD